ncbi:MAG: twin-arginine translocation signal domain-containing protein, partial [Planctomycetes bacterium]|nr:twin-arginine translocation signal domain-containing protein [Planctomycetota bacterium]
MFEFADGNQPFADEFTRRDFLNLTGVTVGGGFLAASSLGIEAAKPKRRPKVAAVFTVFTHRSHAHVMLANFL